MKSARVLRWSGSHMHHGSEIEVKLIVPFAEYDGIRDEIDGALLKGLPLHFTSSPVAPFIDHSKVSDAALTNMDNQAAFDFLAEQNRNKGLFTLDDVRIAVAIASRRCSDARLRGAKAPLPPMTLHLDGKQLDGFSGLVTTPTKVRFGSDDGKPEYVRITPKTPPNLTNCPRCKRDHRQEEITCWFCGYDFTV